MKLLDLFVTAGLISFLSISVARSQTVEQNAFVAVINESADSYQSMGTELQKTNVRRERASRLCSVKPNARVVSWSGTVAQVTSKSGGEAGLVIRLSSRVKFKSANRAFSNNMIKPNNPLYARLLSINIGQKVFFDGYLYSDSRDCFDEMSITERGSVMDPEFRFQFTDVIVFPGR